MDRVGSLSPCLRGRGGDGPSALSTRAVVISTLTPPIPSLHPPPLLPPGGLLATPGALCQGQHGSGLLQPLRELLCRSPESGHFGQRRKGRPLPPAQPGHSRGGLLLSALLPQGLSWAPREPDAGLGPGWSVRLSLGDVAGRGHQPRTPVTRAAALCWKVWEVSVLSPPPSPRPGASRVLRGGGGVCFGLKLFPATCLHHLCAPRGHRWVLGPPGQPPRAGVVWTGLTWAHVSTRACAHTHTQLFG